MRLIDLPRTGAFRLALLFLSLFGVASAGLIGFLYLQTQQFQIANIDDWLLREARAPSMVSLTDVRSRFATHAADNSGKLDQVFTLYGRDGALLAGDRLPMPAPIPMAGKPFFFTTWLSTSVRRYRAVAHRYPGGEIALVAQNMHASSEFAEAFLRTMLWGGLLTVALGLGGGAIVGVGTMRRFDAVAFAIQEIVNGDLSRRLPTRGNAGDLDRLAAVVNGMLDEIERLMDEVKGVCDGIAHDLRTPLTHILAGLERAQRRADTAGDYAAAVENAIADLRSVLRTFAAMLRIAEIEDGARRAGFSPINLTEVGRDVVDFYEPAAEDKGVTLALTAAGAITFVGDAGLMFSALANLVGNAIKFTPAGGRVSIDLTHLDGRTAITIDDTGCGIAPAERDAVLRRFYRTEQSRHHPGNGLGLALVAAIARLHNLTLVIEPRSPGTRIVLRSVGTKEA